MLVEFDDPRDKIRVLHNGPWTFNKQLVLTKVFEGHLQAHKVSMTTADFWVRIHDLPMIACNEYVGKLIGDTLGKVIEVDLDYDDLAWGEYMRVRLALDITKPLLQRKKISLGDHRDYWVRFTYERLPDFCYQCGSLGHSHRECDIWKSRSTDSEDGVILNEDDLSKQVHSEEEGAAKVSDEVISNRQETPSRARVSSSPSHGPSQDHLLGPPETTSDGLSRPK
ncbi:uncharacterized protein At4g02000-like [Carya illinoinensis]|uniref:uncharacterized protein At4g02000-like n=1 Tax=Carya illinoinensis TaxID=32201 RepID=UPI001C723CD7|nr:uncharacterized protein At4g02000-like [Carya illinoinensis]